jgi:hypothetical protein
MVAARSRPRLLPVVAATAGLAGLAAQALIPVSTPLPEIAPSRVRALAVAAPRVAEAVSTPVIASRTLFASARHYAPAAAGAAGAAAGAAAIDPFANATLVGTARARGFAVALVRDATGKVRTVRPGERIGAWRVLAVGNDSASFRQGATVRRLAVGETAQVQPPRAQAISEVPAQ